VHLSAFSSAITAIEDYQLLFTCPPDAVDAICASLAQCSGAAARATGEVTEGGAMMLVAAGGNRLWPAASITSRCDRAGGIGMTVRGRRASWSVIVAASLFIAGYLLKYGDAAYTRPPAEPAPSSPAPAVAMTEQPQSPLSAPALPAALPNRTSAAPPPPPPPASAAERPAPPAAQQPAPAKNAVAKPPPITRNPQLSQDTQALPTPPPPAASALPSPVSSEQAPRLQWQQSEFNFGSLYQNEEITHIFTFRNVGKGPLRLGRLSTSCGCTAAVPAATVIAPGGTGSIKITFKSERSRGSVAKQVYVDSNDPAATRSALTIRGKVKVEVDVVPFGIYFGTIRTGQSIERPVFIQPAEAKQFRILEVKSAHPLITVGQPEPASAPEPAGTYRILVRVGPCDKAASISTHLLIRTDLPHTGEIDIQVYGKVVDLGEPRATQPAR